jgi:hypothetical protein
MPRATSNNSHRLETGLKIGLNTCLNTTHQ